MCGTRKHKRGLVSSLIGEFVPGKHGSFIRKLESVFYRGFFPVELGQHEQFASNEHGGYNSSKLRGQ